MKKSILALAASALFLFCLASCKKDKNAPPTTATSYFHCKIDGKDYKVDGILAYATKFTDEFGIYGLTGDGYQDVCYITLPIGTAKGTYTFNTNIRGSYTDSAQKDYSSLWGQGSGTITIDEITSAYVRGSFSFNAYDSDTETVKKAVTEGTFNVAFR